MPRAVFVLIVIGISIFAGSYFLLNLSKPENATKDPPLASAPAPIDRTLSPTPVPAPASPPPRTERSGQASAPIPRSAPAPLERIEEDPSDSGPEKDADTVIAGRQKRRSNTSPDASKAEAIRHIEDLIDPFEQPIPVDEAEHFVTSKRRLSLIPKEDIERLSLSDMNADEDMAPDAPLTIVHDIEQSERISSQALLVEHKGDLEAQVEVIENDRVESISVADALERIAQNEEDSISVMRQERHFEVTTLDALQSDIDDADRKMSVVRRPYRLEVAELTRLIGKENDDDDNDAVFYIHTVRDRDIDGIWGIIHHGLIDNFAAGMNIEQGDITRRYRIDIPVHSDEVLEDRSSSFLGKLIHEKVRQSIVYNFKEHRIGKNPDRIHPGQEILIVEFRPDELIDLHRYFADDADDD